MQKRIMLLPLLLISLLSTFAGACINATGGWSNCTIIQNASHPMSGIIQTIQSNAPWAFFWLYMTIYASIVIFLLIQDRSLARFNYATLIGLMVGMVFRMYNLIAPVTIIIPISMFILSLVMSIAFR